MSTLRDHQPDSPGFAYLNREGEWLDFERRNVDIVRGRLRLAGLPAYPGPSSPGPGSPGLNGGRAVPPQDPAGIAIGPDGSVFFTDPDHHVVRRIDGCDGDERAVPCIGGLGDAPTSMHNPCGLAVHLTRDALVVADTGNARVQLFSLSTFELLDIWEGFPERLHSPCAVAVSRAGLVYVVDRGGRSVRAFSAGGTEVVSFRQTLSAAVDFADPVAVAVTSDDSAIWVLDRARRALVVVDRAGHVVEEISVASEEDPLGLVVDDVHVGSNHDATGAVVRLSRDGTVVGAARGYTAHVAGLAFDGIDGLLVHPGHGSPVRLVLGAACVDEGIAWGGPFGGFTPARKAWYRLTSDLAPLGDGDHVQFFVHTADDPSAAPPVNEAGPDPFPSSAWAPGPADLGEFLIDHSAIYAWVGVRFGSAGATSPSIDQIKLEFDHSGYIEHLPAIYRDEGTASRFLARYLALAESSFADVEAEIHGWERLLDPSGAPSMFLPVLARWLGVERAPVWDDAALRDAIDDAYVESGWRGTTAGLRAAIRRYTGLDVVIEEPLILSQWWALASADSSDAERSTSVLGVTTMLAGAEPQGAVLGSTARIDRSHLIGSDEYGAPLFDSVAHRFVVRLYKGASSSDESRRAVTSLLEREAPAHTEWTVCDVEPGFGIGRQARIGVDSIIGGDVVPRRLGPETMLGETLVLGGLPPGRIGEQAVVGVTTRLADSVVVPFSSTSVIES